jgi:uncharacterized protein YegL
MKNDYTEILMILDRSGSMGRMVDDTIGGFNTFIEKQKKEDGKCSISLILFNDTYEVKYISKDINEVEKLTTDVYWPHGNTALNDSMAKGINDLGKRLSEMDESERPSKVIVVTMTDGQENASYEYSDVSLLKKIIDHQKEKYSWEFIMIGTSDIQLHQMAISRGLNANKSFTFARGGTGKLGPQGAYDTLACSVSSYRNGTTQGVNFDSAGTEVNS